MTLTYDPQGGDFRALPENLLPEALPSLAGAADQGPFVLFAPDAPDDAKVLKDISLKSLMAASSAKLTEFLIPGENVPCAIPAPLNDARGRPLIVIADFGFAFWNPAFRRGARNAISDVVYLGMGSPTFQLPDTDFAPFYTLADGPDGQDAVFRELARRAPDSLFASPFARSDQLLHGTAMVDLVLEEAEKTGAKVTCLELPIAVIDDRTGDLLQAVLNRAISSVLDRAAGFSDVCFVLPFAFLGGPHSADHPAVAALNKAADEASQRAVPVHVSYVLPMGNHRQDRQHAVLDEMGPGDTSDDLVWRVHHDDGSPNTIEMVVDGGEAVLGLSAPTGEPVKVPLTPGSFGFLRWKGDIIGGVFARPRSKGVISARICLAPTASAVMQGPTPPHGDWRLSLSPCDSKLKQTHLWILRDDMGRLPVQGAPNRASEFFDPHYVRRGEQNQMPMDDAPLSKVKRAGTASVLTNAQKATTVSALGLQREGTPQIAPYSGQSIDSSEGQAARLVDIEPGIRGGSVLGNGTARRFQFAGTSAASAKAL